MPPTADDADATLIAPLAIDEYREAGASDDGPPEGAGEQGRDQALGVPTAPTEREKQEHEVSHLPFSPGAVHVLGAAAAHCHTGRLRKARAQGNGYRFYVSIFASFPPLVR